MIIAIDGPAGSGKSSTAKEVAAQLGITYLDTGAMYRAITLKSLRNKIAATDDPSLEKLILSTEIGFSGSPPNIKVWMDGEDVSDAIRSDEVTKKVSDYCAPLVVRTALVEQQQKFGKNNSLVCDGRDIGTVVFPDAELKFFMVASAEERAKRRQKDFEKLGIKKSLLELQDDLLLRDHKDSTRVNSPLCKANDAEEIDTTSMSFEKQVEYIVTKAKLIINNSK
jgi:cytidylate kinase